MGKNKKLQLSEETLMQLNEMDKIYGGDTTHPLLYCVLGVICHYQSNCNCPPIQLVCHPSCGQDRLCVIDEPIHNFLCE